MVVLDSSKPLNAGDRSLIEESRGKKRFWSLIRIDLPNRLRLSA